jgi:prepilin-type N-terminal cleavage/methylation domain-containing protein
VRFAARGFTLIEILIVIVILAIAAMTAIPMMGSAASVQIRSAGNMIAADLEYAKSLAISRGQSFWVVFDEGADSYSIEGLDAVGNRITISHPVKKGFNYVIDFKNEGLGRVDITDADFDGASQVQFDYLGSPDNGGTVRLQAGAMSATVSVEPVTGYITVGN